MWVGSGMGVSFAKARHPGGGRGGRDGELWFCNEGSDDHSSYTASSEADLCKRSCGDHEPGN
jgi:hypothetical protein